MSHWLRHMVLLLALTGLVCSCTQRHEIREARQIVATADRLQTAGDTFEDSLALAFAVSVLEHHKIKFPTDYAHANFHYGCLLNSRGNHPEAIQAFLRTVYSRTKDSEIKALAYDNIADMCNLAAEYGLPEDLVDQYEKPNQKRLPLWLLILCIAALTGVFAFSKYIAHTKNTYHSLSRQINDIVRQKRATAEDYCRFLHTCPDLKTVLHWDEYEEMCMVINDNLYQLAYKLQNDFGMTARDVQICILVLAKIPYVKMADILNLSLKSMARLKFNAAKKLDTNMRNLRRKLLEIVCNDGPKE